MILDDDFKQHLIDEYHETLIKINAWDRRTETKESLSWWVGNRDRIEMLNEYFTSHGYGIQEIPTGSAVRIFPSYNEMSPKIQKMYNEMK
jgi:hypothetical protein